MYKNLLKTPRRFKLTTYLRDSRGVDFIPSATCSVNTMCNKFKFQHHEINPYCISDIRQVNLKKTSKNVEIKDSCDIIENDVLALSTEYLKVAIQYINAAYEKVRKSNFYSVLTNTTQPAHVIIIVASLLIVGSFKSSNQVKSDNNLFKFIYAATTAAHFGSQIWMTFASGLSLYFSLPRHHFGEVQKVLFPLYFTLTSAFSLVMLLTHLHLMRRSETTIILVLCFAVELVVRLYLCEPLIRLICVKNEIEARHGLGMEIGQLSKDSALFQSKEYLSVHKQFRRLHMFIAFSNVACIGFSTAHLYLTASDVFVNS